MRISIPSLRVTEMASIFQHSIVCISKEEMGWRLHTSVEVAMRTEISPALKPLSTIVRS